MSRISKVEKGSKSKLPKGAEIIEKRTDINIEEIENGFILTKSYNIEYKVKDKMDYLYHTKKWFSKEDPLTVNTDNKELAEIFNE